MKHFLRKSLVALAVTATAFCQTDVAGSKDYPGITRMPNTYISSYNHLKFDSFDFPVKDGNREKKQPVEGAHTFIRYNIRKGVPLGSALETIRNYQNAARTAGGEVLYEYVASENRRTTFRLKKDASEVWVYINAYTVDYEVHIIERQAMTQQVTVDAAAMASSIANTGSVAIYGVYFDTGKSDLKPESESALVEIGRMLAGNPALKVYIVGHTDMVGDAAGNLKLSQARAQSVINALASRHGIAANRMIAFGNGPYAPVASNKTDEGRAKNRRVDLVEIATK